MSKALEVRVGIEIVDNETDWVQQSTINLDIPDEYRHDVQRIAKAISDAVVESYTRSMRPINLRKVAGGKGTEGKHIRSYLNGTR